MPKLLRSMQCENGHVRPQLGDTATKLGVRESDIRRDENQLVQPRRGGVSVVSSLDGLRRRVAKKRFPPTMIPRRLADRRIVPGAIGPNTLHIFRIGEGAFADGILNEHLFFEVDRQDNDHGTIQPNTLVTIEVFRSAVQATQLDWSCGEENE